MTTQGTRERLSAKEILAYDDKQLDQYLGATHRQGSYRSVAVEDPENLTEEFFQRLRDRTHQPKSAPVNPQLLTARLLEAPTHEERSATRSSSPASPASLASTVFATEEQDYENAKQYEREAYLELIHSSGRPTHPVEQMEKIAKEPGELREILTFWQFGLARYNWAVFWPQRDRWMAFQRIQRHVREGRFEYDEVLFQAVRFETWEKFIERYPLTTGYTRGFPEYAQSAKERLARNGFTRPFELDLDLTKQDKLTTWIEYLNWEYIRYEDYADNAKQDQRLHDKAWKKLVDSGVLKPGETEEVLCTFDHGLRRSSERHDAERAVDLAEKSLASAEQAIASSQSSRAPLQQLQSRVDAARATLDAAKDAHTSIKRRNVRISDFCRTTMDFRSCSRNAERHLKLLRWMLQQVPLIEQESSPAVSSRAGRKTREANAPSRAAACASADEASTQSPPDGAAGKLSQAQRINAVGLARSGIKRRRAEVGDDAHGSKRAKRDELGKAPPRTYASATSGCTLLVKPGDQSRSSNGHVRRTRPPTPQHCACDQPTTGAAAGGGLRRSARIAALPRPGSKTTISLAPLPQRRRHTSRIYPLSPVSSDRPGVQKRTPDDGSRSAKKTRIKEPRRMAVVRDT